MKNFILLLTTVLFFACGEPAEPAATVATTGDFTGYEIAKVAGSEFEKATKKNGQTGQVIEDGFILNGRKTGTWTTYHSTSNLTVYTATNYVDGKREGLYFEAEKNNRVKSIGSFSNDVKHGKWITYNFSRREVEQDYKNGKLHGFSRTFYKTGKDGQVKEEIEFDNGVQHGSYRYYKEDGTITMDYVYKNGEIIERKKQG